MLNSSSISGEISLAQLIYSLKLVRKGISKSKEEVAEKYWLEECFIHGKHTCRGRRETHITGDPGNLPALPLTEWYSSNISGEIVADDRPQKSDLPSKAGESWPCTRSHSNPFIWNEDLEGRGTAIATVVRADPGISIRSLSKLLWNALEDLCSWGVYSLASAKRRYADGNAGSSAISKLPASSQRIHVLALSRRPAECISN